MSKIIAALDLRRTPRAEEDVVEEDVEVEEEEEEEEEQTPAGAIQRALATATTVAEVVDIKAIKREMDQLREAGRRLLPIEAAAKQELSLKGRALQRRHDWGVALQDLEGLKRLDPEVFSWTKRQELIAGRGYAVDVPVFAYIPLDEKEFRAELRWVSSVSYTGNLPQEIRENYDKVFQPLARTLTGWGDGKPDRAHFTYTYAGVIPQEIRNTITKEQTSKRFTRLGLVCEVDTWVYTESPTRMYMDPILVGEREGALWVLASFDPTPVEQYVMDEFQK